jgi:hypothetical protein
MSKVTKKIGILFFFISILGCNRTSVKTHNTVELNFLDEFVLPEAILVDSTLVGGLSGIDYYGGNYYLACDDPYNPRYYIADININKLEISDISIEKVIRIQDTSRYFDMESIRYDPKTDMVLFTSEGHIKSQKNPLFFSSDSTGKIENYFKIPLAFYSNSEQGPRHNGTLEGLSNSYNANGYWIAMESPLEIDGPEPQLRKTKSPVRITYINTNTNKATSQFGYYLDPVAKQPQEDFSINGLTELLQYDINSFFVIERSYSSGLGNQGYTVKIFNVDATKATNTIKMDSLTGKDYMPAKKTLLLDFENYRDKLTNGSIDNIEGMTFGPTLFNGNKSLILVADNNFNNLDPQLNQFILLEIAKK